MAADAASQEPRRTPATEPLPNILAVQVVRARYDPPQRHVIDRKMTEVTEAVEVIVQTDAPIPIRALAPALHIGDETLTESEPAGHLRYRFFAFHPDRLKEGEPIALGWTMSRSPITKSTFRYPSDKTD